MSQLKKLKQNFLKLNAIVCNTKSLIIEKVSRYLNKNLDNQFNPTKKINKLLESLSGFTEEEN